MESRSLRRDLIQQIVISVCFYFKNYRNLFGSRYDLAMATFNLWTDTRQISAAPNSHQYLIQLVPFWKMKSFATKWIAFFGAKSRCFLPRLRSPTKATFC